MNRALLIAVAAILVGSAGEASAQTAGHESTAMQCRHMGHASRHPKGCPGQMRCGGCDMGKMPGMQGMDHSGAGADQMTAPDHAMGHTPMTGGAVMPSPTPSPRQ